MYMEVRKGHYTNIFLFNTDRFTQLSLILRHVQTN